MGSDNFTVSTDAFIRRTLIVIGLVAAVILFAVFTWQILSVLVLLFAGILLGVLLTSTSGWIRERTPLSHGQALTVVLVLIILAFVGGGWFAVPRLASQSQELSTSLMESVERLRSTLESQSWAQPFLNTLPGVGESNSNSLNIMGQMSRFFSRTFNFLIDSVIILFIGLYLAINPDMYANGLIKLFPKSRRRRIGEALDETAYVLRWWLVGRIASMVVVGILSIIGLMILGVPLAFILGVITALLAFIPIVGPTIALIPPSLVALTDSGPTQALYVILLYLGIQFVESYLITPLIQQRTVSLPPVLLIMSQAIFSLFFNFIGLAVAAPFAAMVMTLTKMLYVKDVLGDEDVELIKENPQPKFEASQEAVQSAQTAASD